MHLFVHTTLPPLACNAFGSRLRPQVRSLFALPFPLSTRGVVRKLKAVSEGGTEQAKIGSEREKENEGSLARHLTVEQLGQVSFFPLHQQSSESQVPSSSPFSIDIDSIADDKDFILIVLTISPRMVNISPIWDCDKVEIQVYKVAAAEGATFLNEWFVGCNASHVVCEGTSIQKYIGHSSNLVTVSAILLHLHFLMNEYCVGIMLDNAQNGIYGEIGLKTFQLPIFWHTYLVLSDIFPVAILFSNLYFGLSEPYNVFIKYALG
ncbi:hypothetical protein HYC85_003596 [Camellia sinensis]|uniref:Uncharacterized protein n=1 Tax=Camellia sinensis TaxID=4442 RepID=A0A7J7HVV3_CAMSI|nr:hypothetical protein HYC85_003596 [Camellia sinensis]